MIILLVIVLLAAAVRSDIVADGLESVEFYEAIQTAIQYGANNNIDWAVNLTLPPDMSQMVHVYCAKPTTKTFIEVPLNDQNASQKIDFVNLRTIFLIHGFRSNVDMDWVTKFKINWATSNREVNFCVVDWSSLAYKDYVTVAVRNMRLVANYLSGLYIPGLQTQGLLISDIILIGHSLGAHISGLIGQTFKNQIEFIIGMDPAGSLFQGIPEIFRLSDDDATYVQAIHTCMGFYGYAGVTGDADYFINIKTFPQPQCQYPTLTDVFTSTVYPILCSHFRAVDLIADSLLYPNQYSCIGVLCWTTAQYGTRLCGSPYKTDLFGLDTTQKHGTFYATSGTTQCSGTFW